MAEEISELYFINKASLSLEESATASIVDFLNGRVAENGGFVNRAGSPDIYYTYFGSASLVALGVGLPDAVKKYILSFVDGDGLNFVHLCSLARCRGLMGLRDQATEMVLKRIEEYRSVDGGYSHTARGSKEGTAYAAFLVSRAYGDCGVNIPGKDEMLSSVEVTSTSVTTVLAASMLLLSSYDKKSAGDMAETIIKRCDSDGGFKASSISPMPDLLSTAAGLYALTLANVPISGILDKCAEFVEMLWLDDGGFAGTVADLLSDVEYTYYGLVALGCLTNAD